MDSYYTKKKHCKAVEGSSNGICRIIVTRWGGKTHLNTANAAHTGISDVYSSLEAE